MEPKQLDQCCRRGLSSPNHPRDHVGRRRRRLLRAEQPEDRRHRLGRVPWRGRRHGHRRCALRKTQSRRKAAIDLVQE
uniref:Uncharacterized protein n=1 Tax=Arundo donax TaxID=35708 RepID=A0A0A9C569_ARUDO